MYVNRHWCSIITVKEQLCTEHLELLTVALRPYYLSREFNQLFITAVYIHPAADVKLAGEGVGRVIHRLSSLSPDSSCFVMGDFNECRLNRVLPHFKQYVTCLTYKDKTIDLRYGNIPGASTSRPLSRLGRSDHNMVHPIPDEAADKICENVEQGGHRIPQRLFPVHRLERLPHRHQFSGRGG